jgi:hypothetical protein
MGVTIIVAIIITTVRGWAFITSYVIVILWLSHRMGREQGGLFQFSLCRPPCENSLDYRAGAQAKFLIISQQLKITLKLIRQPEKLLADSSDMLNYIHNSLQKKMSLPH